CASIHRIFRWPRVSALIEERVCALRVFDRLDVEEVFEDRPRLAAAFGVDLAPDFIRNALEKPRHRVVGRDIEAFETVVFVEIHRTADADRELRATHRAELRVAVDRAERLDT